MFLARDGIARPEEGPARPARVSFAGVALVTAMLGCQWREAGEPAEDAAVQGAAASSATTAAASVATTPLRCQGLAKGDSAANAGPPPSAQRADASPRSSDGTLQHLPPPPASEAGHVLLLRYSDFGPPSLQAGLLGQEWWSWESGGSFEPGDEFDVRVVVYQGRSRAEVEGRYPTVKGESDYRLIERDEAVRYLNAQIAELAVSPTGPDEFDFGPLRRELERTRSTIVGCLPVEGAPGG